MQAMRATALVLALERACDMLIHIGGNSQCRRPDVVYLLAA
ncbi:hypothetical protein [Xanthomonas sp. BRIP62415]|nr:hypothetical protein [Xanthomonas sp. BRIP62415]